tara:strand:- start:822 stop:1283 length:462 start_codon:yes stop_codon:yes gene_type:complete
LRYQFLVVFLVLLSIDLGIKYYINSQEFDSFTLIPFLLDFLLVKNTGVAFSFLSSSNMLIQSALILIIMTALGFLIYSFFKTTDNLQKIALVLIISGGFGNFIERLFYGSVTDYLYLHFGKTPLFIFNFADLLITIGACIIIFVWLSGNEQKD